MYSERKSMGIVLSVKRVSPYVYLCKILFSNSILRQVFILDRRERLFISVGCQVFGTLYFSNDKSFFNVESLEYFLGAAFWTSGESLINLLRLIKMLDTVLPANLYVKQVYTKFVDHIKLIKLTDQDVSSSFKEWLVQALN